MAPLLDVRNLRTYYMTHRGAAKAVDDVSFQISQGEFIGLAGESGCGKTTTAYSILRLIPPPGRIVGGQIFFKGRDLVTMDENTISKIRGNSISMVFQQAMSALNPVIKIGEQLTEPILIHRSPVDKKQAVERSKELFELVGLSVNRLNNYPFEFSGGMRQRAIIAMSLTCDPDLVIADEPVTALDVSIQAQIIDLLQTLKGKINMSMLLITHDLSVIAETCDKIAIMYGGKIVENAGVKSIFKDPIHPYTKSLIRAIPSMERGKTKTLFSVPGKPPNLLNQIVGCNFADRCPYAKEICRREAPKPEEHGGVACHFADEMKDIDSEQLWDKFID
jgi:oligopeptide/dipeptide ABC transporter ATP-binding protein